MEESIVSFFMIETKKQSIQRLKRGASGPVKDKVHGT